MGRLNYVKVLRESVYTKLCMVKDLEMGEYFVEKSLTVNIDFQKRLFENELKMHRQFHHRYIIKFIREPGDRRFLMEYAAAGNLQKVIDSDENEKMRLKLSLNFIKGAFYLHELGFVHNDIKPSNILLTREKRAKLTDFAFCGKIGEVTFDDIPPYFVLGTEYFIPPQETNSYVNLVSKDIYAIGKVLYLLFSGASIERQEPNLTSISNTIVRDVTRNCLDGYYQSLAPVIQTLSQR
ncbi:MAG: protein kinase family protein [bacterium]|nr:protein kinase family protein [bacterium]